MKISETETIIKKVLPYLERRGYDIQTDLKFEEPAVLDTEYKKGFIDILVTLGKKNPTFLIEAKRDGTNINAKHRKQAINYGKSKKCLFVSVTNGQYFELINTTTGDPLQLNGSAFNKLPRKSDLISTFVPQIKKDNKTSNIEIHIDKGLPFRPGLPLTKLNHLIQQCHNSIRKIEKDEEYAFSDFSKILFLKLLEEKWDIENTTPLYSYYFHELAEIPTERADQVRTAIKSMIQTIKDNTKYGEVLSDPIKLKKDATYLSIIKRISSVSWNDCNLDSKGAAFEYFVRATLKGKRLGQYFTPRPLVQLMLHLGRYKQIINNLQANEPFKVLDPACGTGGFLVFAMNNCLNEIKSKLKNNEIHESLGNILTKKIKEETFFGIDAHEGVASSAKMNMIIAGDGHNNIKYQDSLKLKTLLDTYSFSDGRKSNKAHLILTNPPFGTSEGESLTKEELSNYKIKSTRGQSLFIQKMILSIENNSRIVTVIDDGVLNTLSYRDLREHILQECKIEYVLSLPSETFKPNKINVKSSVLVLKKREEIDDEFEDEYPIIFICIDSLGYDGAGLEMRNFNLNTVIQEIENIDSHSHEKDHIFNGYNWKGFLLDSKEIISDENYRLDFKYWDLSIRTDIGNTRERGGSQTIKDLNILTTKRGNSPSPADYVSEEEGFALVVKAGTNISKTGTLLTAGDYIEESLYQSYKAKNHILSEGDILLSSTGEGTLGKCCVYRNNGKPAIADGHVTTIRVNSKDIYPEYICDYLRKGFGSDQINRLYTGSTGLIEIAPEDVDKILIPPLPKLAEQKLLSIRLRGKEVESNIKINTIIDQLNEEKNHFYQKTK